MQQSLNNYKLYHLKRQKQEFKNVKNLYEKILLDLSIKLNELHKINWPLRSWRIFIGPWLETYIAIMLDRINLCLLDKSNINKNYNNKIIYNFTTDINTFQKICSTYNWNNSINYRIYHLIKSRKFDFKYLKNFHCATNTISNKSNFLDWIKIKCNFFFSNFFFIKKNRYLIDRVYIGNFIKSLSILIKLKEFPIKFSFLSKKDFKNHFDFVMRKKILISKNSDDIKTKIIKYFLSESIPNFYIENFKYLKKDLKKYNLPKKKFIVTGNCWTDNLFKFYLAEMVSKGSKLIINQHGAGYALIKDHSAFNHEIKIADKFIAWGNVGKFFSNKKIISGNVPPHKINFFNQKKNLTIIGHTYHQFKIKNDLWSPNKSRNDKKNIKKLINKINMDIYSNILFKGHPADNFKKNSYKNYVNKNFKKVTVCQNNDQLNKLINNSKLCVFLYIGTDFLKNLSNSIPSIIILNDDFNYEKIFSFAKPYLKKLEKVNIVHTDGNSAGDFINSLNGNVEKWWSDAKLQKSLNEFKNIFASYEKNYSDKFYKILRKNK